MGSAAAAGSKIGEIGVVIRLKVPVCFFQVAWSGATYVRNRGRFVHVQSASKIGCGWINCNLSNGSLARMAFAALYWDDFNGGSWKMDLLLVDLLRMDSS